MLLMEWAVAVIAADQLTKAWILRHYAAGAERPVLARAWFEIRMVRHSFMPGGMNSAAMLLLLWGAVIGGIAVIVHNGAIFQHATAHAALGLAIGGATSNLIDRLRCGAVINFLRVGWWPVFNLGDVAIALGVPGALWWMR